MAKKISEEERESILHLILSRLLLNGVIQGSENRILDYSVLEFAKKEIKKLYGKKQT